MDQAFDYHDTVVYSDINRADHVRKKPERVKRLMRSYARNQGAQTPNTVLVQDISVNGEASMDAETVASYLNVLRKIFVVEDMPAGNPNMRSKTAIRSSDTRYMSTPLLQQPRLRADRRICLPISEHLAFFLKYCVSATCAYLRMRSAAKFIIIATRTVWNAILSYT